VKTAKEHTFGRIASIDIFRALTMMMMIFVNDFASLRELPRWIGHAGHFVDDFLGFSDLIFPSFLFAVGLSIPFAIENRLSKDSSKWKTLLYILTRTFALIVMGLFMVNAGSISMEITGMRRQIFSLMMVAGFFLVWNVYPKAKDWKKYLFAALQIVGVALLVYLAVIYRDTTGAIMQKRWWGILGQIGWTYLPCAVVYLLWRKNLTANVLALVFFTLFNKINTTYDKKYCH